MPGRTSTPQRSKHSGVAMQSQAGRNLRAVPFAVLVTLALTTTIAACGGKDEGDDDTSGYTPATETPQADPTERPRTSPTPTPIPPPYLAILSPEEGEHLYNPILFAFEAEESIRTVDFECDGWTLNETPIPADQQTFSYTFTGVNYLRTVVLTGYNETGAAVSQTEVHFVPVEQFCPIPDQPGFNHYTIEAINDWALYPKNGFYHYCWSGSCGDVWGQIHDGYYADTLLFDGGDDCYCSGHTLEIFLRAYQLYLEDHGLSAENLFQYEDNTLPVDSLYTGVFYQYWQGYEVTDYASAADAFEYEGIGVQFFEEDWDDIMPGDFVNLWRSNGSGHSVIFIDWLTAEGHKIGLRYYSCNTSGESCPDSSDENNTWGNSGPSFNEEYFEGADAYLEGAEGSVLPELLFIGRPFLPTLTTDSSR